MKIFKLTVILLTVLIAASCAKKVDIKPPEAFDPEVSFKKANQLIDKKQFETARRELERIKGKDRGMKYTPLAHLRVADTYMLEGEPEPAIEEYRRFLVMYPAHKYAPYAQYQIGMIYYGQIEDHERGQDAAHRALEEFAKLNELYPRNPYRESLVYYIEKCRDTIANHTLMVGNFYFKKRAYEPAVRRYLEVLRGIPEFKGEEEAFYRLAISYLKLGDAGMAEEYLNRLLEKYPDGKFAEEAKKEFARPKDEKG